MTASELSVQETTLPLNVQPLEALTKVTPDGMVVVTTTPVAMFGPVLVSVRVYVSTLPATPVVGCVLPCSSTSATGVGVLVMLGIAVAVGVLFGKIVAVRVLVEAGGVAVDVANVGVFVAVFVAVGTVSVGVLLGETVGVLV